MAKKINKDVFVKYTHHGNDVWVNSELHGRHREHCLCYSCKKFDEKSMKKNCSISNRVFKLCVMEELVLPVWECPKFEVRSE